MFKILYNLLGETLTRLQRHEEAEQWFKASLEAKPDHVPAHLTYGKLLAKNVSHNFTYTAITAESENFNNVTSFNFYRGLEYRRQNNGS